LSFLKKFFNIIFENDCFYVNLRQKIGKFAKDFIANALKIAKASKKMMRKHKISENRLQSNDGSGCETLI